MKPDPQTRSARRRRMWLPHAVFALVALLTAGAAWEVRVTSEANDRLRFESATQRTVDDVRYRLQTYVSILRAGAGLFAADREVSAEEFRRFVERLELQTAYPGVQGVGFAASVPDAGRGELAARVRAQGRPDFRVTPERGAEQSAIIVHLEPQDRRNRAAIGFDMFSEAARREALERARDTGRPAATARLTLVQEIDERKQAGFLIYVPVYHGGAIPEDGGARRAALRGFVYAPFRADDLLLGVFGNEPNPLVDFRVYDGPAPTPGGLLHGSDLVRGEPEARPAPRFTRTTTFEVEGRPWSISFFERRGSAVASGDRGWAFVLLAGLAFGLTLFFVTRAQVRARARTEEVAAEARASERRFRTLVEQSPVSTQILSPDGRTVRVNRAWEELWGATLEQLGDYNILRDPQLEQKGIAPYIRRGFGGEPTVIPAILYDPNETIPGVTSNEDPGRWVSAVIYPVKDDDGRVREVVLMHEDITDRKRAEEERERLLESERRARREAEEAGRRAEEASRLKDEFLATLSHELRTPLTSILGWAKLLRAGGLSAEAAARGLEAIERNAEAQTRLIGDLLDVSRVITGKLRLDARALELSRVVEAGVESVRPAAQARGVRLDVRLDDGAGPVWGDPDRLQQVVWNLLSNAIKFTPKGGRVTVRLARSGGHAEVSVEDTGPGISAEFLPHVFERFRQADGRISREHGGLGLGLAIARHLVELHGGTISASSPGEGRGATFSFSLPLMEGGAGRR